MTNQLEYVFETEPDAYRFLNTVKHFDAEKLVVKYGRSSFHVKVEYSYKSGEFDSTSSELDDLAASMSGQEV